MDEQQIAPARQSKKFYVTVFQATVLFWIFDLLVGLIFPGNKILKHLDWGVSIGLIPFHIIATWKLTRAIQVRKSLCILNSSIAILFFIIQGFFLLRLYSKRTGIGIGLLLQDREHNASSSPLLIIPFLFFGIPIIFLTASVIYVLLLPPDITQVSDSDLTYIFVPVPEEQNAFFDIEKSSQSLSLTKVQNDLLKEHLEGRKWDKAFVGNVLKENSKAIDHFLNGCKKTKFVDPTISFQIDNSTPIPNVSSIVSASRLVALRALQLWRTGNQKAAFETLSKLCDLGLTIQNAPVSMMHYAVGLSVTNISLKTMNQCLKQNSPRLESLNEGLKYLDRLVVGADGLKSAFRIEYLSMNNLVFKKRWPDEFEPQNVIARMSLRPFKGLLYKPNATKQLFADFYRARIAELDKPFSEIEREPSKNFYNRINPLNADNLKRLNPKALDNAIGKIVVSIGVPSFKLTERMFDMEALIMATRTNFALHAYRLENGKSATTVADLSPKYLKAVPLDPFDGKPIRYSNKKGTIYFVGKNLTDAGGSEGEIDDWSKMDDPTLKVSY